MRVLLFSLLIVYILAIARAQDSSCVVGSLYCSPDCADVAYCSSTGPIVVETCPNNTVCDHVTARCENGTECPTPPTPGDFRCNGVGYFPDPTACTTYHFCCEPSGNSTVYQCPGSSVYDPLTSLCSGTSTDRVCVEQPIPTCEVAGELGAQQENNNIYYVCRRVNATIAPSLYKCPTDQVFEVNKCVSRFQVTTTPSTTTFEPSPATKYVATLTALLSCQLLLLGHKYKWKE